MRSTEPIENLRKYVSTLEEGKIDDEHEQSIIILLIRSWNLFSGSSVTSMDTEKLGRMENLTYRSPDIITFEIERHGATVRGSTYADVHQWVINLTKMEADCNPFFKKRSVGLRDAPLKIQPIAQIVANAILNLNKEKKYLEWKSNDKVKILIGDIIPKTNLQTTTSRRKRFRDKLDEILKPHGWSRPNISNIYVKNATDD